ncbi:MAG: FAD binding domain-containing protein [Ardenticatenia bacterium]|nr:FAD binding domain-containing protein [Ardenticatenia bacterium]
MPVVLLALEATVVLCSPDGEEEQPLEAFYATWDGRPLQSLIARVRVPAPTPGAAARLVRVARTPRDQAILTVAAVSAREGERLACVRVAAGGIGPRPARLRQVESALEGRVAAPKEVEEAVAIALKGFPPARRHPGKRGVPPCRVAGAGAPRCGGEIRNMRCGPWPGTPAGATGSSAGRAYSAASHTRERRGEG